MKKLLPFFLLLIVFISCKDDDNTPKKNGNSSPEFAVDIGSSVIPYVIIDTEGSIPNEPKVGASVEIYISKELVFEHRIGIEYRGSTSFRISDKKSYGIETWDGGGSDVKVSILGMPAEEDWILNGHVVSTDPGNLYIWDPSLMRHFLAYELYRSLGNYASRCKFVELELNGQYQGVYVFMEKLKRDGDRIDISKLSDSDTDISGGYILKIDKTAGGDANEGQPLEYYLTNWEDDHKYTFENSFRSKYNTKGQELTLEPYGNKIPEETYFQYEYPKYDEITTAQKDYIQQYIDDFETALLNDDFESETRTYTDYIDMDSFVDFFIINELCRNVDGYRLSTFLHKDKGGKLKIGPPWDFNIGFDDPDGRVAWDGWVINYNENTPFDTWLVPFWWPRLMEDPQFTAKLKARWTALRVASLSNSSIMNVVDTHSTQLMQNGSITRNFARWDHGIGVNYEASISSLKDFLEYRLNWMDSEIAGF